MVARDRREVKEHLRLLHGARECAVEGANVAPEDRQSGAEAVLQPLCVGLGAAAHPNLNRINLVWFPLLLLAAVGIDAVILARPLLIATITVYTLTFGSFAATYFGDYAERMSPVFFESFIEAITVASTSTTERVCVTNQVNMPAIFAALAGEVDPRSFASTVQYEDPRAEVRNVIAVDRYVFGLHRCAHQAFGAYVLGLAEQAAFPAERFRLTRLKRYIVAVPR